MRFAYGGHDIDGRWFRSYGNENCELEKEGLMLRRIASINDAAILASKRKFVWPTGPRAAGYASLRDFGC